jgi:RimJ/RimL family protein N-acetyltransferase
MIFVVEHESQLTGFLAAFGGGYQRDRHSAYIVVGILQGYTGQGIGKLLFKALDEWALAHKLHRLELTVMSHNERALHLYQKMGFVIEGTKKDSLCVNGAYVDEYYMTKILG